MATHPARDVVPMRDAMRVWVLVALQSFGGPAGQIAVMQHHLVDERRWVGRQRFLHALNFCTLLPGPEAQQLSVYLGWLLNGVRGGLLAGALFVLPGVLAMLALSAAYVAYGHTDVVAGVFAGLAPAVLAIVAQALWRIGRHVLAAVVPAALAVSAFLALAVLAVPFPVVVAVAAVVGWLHERGRAARAASNDDSDGSGDSGCTDEDDGVLLADRPGVEPARPARPWTVVGVGVLAWALPMAAVALVAGTGSTPVREGLFFSATALVTFGGAYAVLSFVAQQAVENYGWLGPGEMVRGLALAETTPGPLIMVVQFVAFLGAYRDPGSLDPWVAAVVGALLTTWVTFVPSFVLVLAGAPYVERLRQHQGLSSALRGVTAAVVGVIANLAVYFATHTLFAEVERRDWGWLHFEAPVPGSLQPTALGIAVVAALLAFAARWSPLRVLGVCAVAGLLAQLLGLT